MIKHSFKFLNALGFCPEKENVFPIGQCNEVGGSVISPNTIQMMNKPTIRQGFAMILFPNIKVFTDITFGVRFGMDRHPYEGVFTHLNSPTFPAGVPLPVITLILGSTRTTPFSPISNPNATIAALLVMLASPLPIMFLASLFTHILIMSHAEMIVKRTKQAEEELKQDLKNKIKQMEET